MEFTITTLRGKVPVMVVKPHGDMDASNYTELVKKVEGLINDGSLDFLIDLSDVPFMSSAGLVALHSLARTLRGDNTIDPKTGWAMLKSISASRDHGPQEHIKLLSPQANVAETIEKAGFNQFFTVFTDMKAALESF
jgi:anti-anti-sigma factor